MLTDISQPGFGASLSAMAFVSLALTFLRSTLRWAVFGCLLTIGLAQAAWSLLGPVDDPLATSGHVAASLGLFWSVAVWLMRWRLDERGRLRARHPSIAVGQFICLATCLYTVLVNIYFMVAQFGLALIHTWSYTVLTPQRWGLTDVSAPVDFLLVAAACVVVTHSTRSAYLLVPLFWAMFLAMVRQCSLIPPVAPEPGALSSDLTGAPSLWLLALLLGSAVMMGVLVAAQGLSWKSSPRVAWQKDVAFLLRPPRTWPGMEQSAAALGMFILVIGCLLLVFPSPAGSFINVLPSVVCSVVALIAAIAVFTVANRHWAVSLGEIGVGLLTLSICSAVLAFVPSNPPALSDRFPLIFNALVLGCVLCTFFWVWLGGVWEQQLDEQGQAWTTAGRLVPLAKRGGFMAGAFGVLFSLHMGIWPVLDQVEGFDNSSGRIFWGYGCMILLMVAVCWGYSKTPGPAFRTLIMLNSVALVLYGYVRVLPYTSLGY